MDRLAVSEFEELMAGSKSLPVAAGDDSAAAARTASSFAQEQRTSRTKQVLSETLVLAVLTAIAHSASFIFQLGYHVAYGLPLGMVGIGVPSVFSACVWLTCAFFIRLLEVKLVPRGRSPFMTCGFVLFVCGFGEWYRVRGSLAGFSTTPLWSAFGAVVVLQLIVPQFIQRSPPQGRPEAKATLRERMLRKLELAEDDDTELLGPSFGRIFSPRWLLCFALFGSAVAYSAGITKPYREHTYWVTGTKHDEYRWMVVRTTSEYLVLAEYHRETFRLTGKYRVVDVTHSEIPYLSIERLGRAPGGLHFAGVL